MSSFVVVSLPCACRRALCNQFWNKSQLQTQMETTGSQKRHLDSRSLLWNASQQERGTQVAHWRDFQNWWDRKRRWGLSPWERDDDDELGPQTFVQTHREVWLFSNTSNNFRQNSDFSFLELKVAPSLDQNVLPSCVAQSLRDGILSHLDCFLCAGSSINKI
jgi:hypothetical protein